ncbi:MAG: ATP-binding cassette domain-containing protein [Gemmataceae bacterium]
MDQFINLVRLGKSFPGVVALKNVDLTLRPGSIHALIGENGAGKSTLINILSGGLRPDEGEIRIDGKPCRIHDPRDARRQGIVTVHQEVNLFADLTVMENIALERGLATNRLGWINWRTERSRTEAALSLVGNPFPPTVSAGRMSPAQRQLTEIAASLADRARLLVLDEPTSSLAEAETRLLFTRLRKIQSQGTAILYVSHRLEEIFELADEVTVLRDGRRVWNGQLAQTSAHELIRLMVGREVVKTNRRAVQAAGPIRFRCDDLTDEGGRYRNVSVEVRAGEVLGVYGLVGAGRTEWAQAVFGLRAKTSGSIWVDGQLVRSPTPAGMIQRGLVYLPEDRLRQGLCRGLSVRLNIVLASLRRLATSGWLTKAREGSAAKQTVSQLAIRLRSLEQPVGSLSGGNQQKAVLGRWLNENPGVLFLDEPTRGIDVGAKGEIYHLIDRLAQQGKATVFISSDLPEIMAQSDRVVVFREGQIACFLDPRTSTADQVAAAALPNETRTPEGHERQESFLNSHLPNSLLRKQGDRFLSWLRQSALLLVILAIMALLQIKTGDYLAGDTLRELSTNAALLSFCAVGAMLVILAGGIDISLGALMALSAGVAGRLWEQGHSLPLVAVVAVTVGACGGALNAGVSLIGRVHPIVVTLGTMSIFRGLTLWWIEQDVQVPGTARHWLVSHIFGLPVGAWAGIALVFVVGMFLNRTVWGREIYAMGSNPTAAQRVGIHKTRVWLRAFTLQGMLAGVAGLLYLARSGNVQSTSYEDKTLEAIAAAILGGVAVTGGRGHVWGVAVGCVFLVLLAPACILLHIFTNWQRTLVGSVLVAAVLLDSVWQGRKS